MRRRFTPDDLDGESDGLMSRSAVADVSLNMFRGLGKVSGGLRPRFVHVLFAVGVGCIAPFRLLRLRMNLNYYYIYAFVFGLVQALCGVARGRAATHLWESASLTAASSLYFKLLVLCLGSQLVFSEARLCVCVCLDEP